MTDQTQNESQVASAEDIAAAQAATQEFTNTIGDAIVDDSAEAEAPAAPATADMSQPIQTVGRRKRAIARVTMTLGTGKITVNGREFEDYFPSKLNQQNIKAPLSLVEREGQFDIRARIAGGGPTGQAGAMRLAIARALNEYNPAERKTLKKAGFLTRDARAVERKKAGLHKARRAPQYSKR